MVLTLVILAAGMGKRFGGDKQIEPVGPNGELIIDYSVTDAVRAGFKKIVFVIRKDIEEAFRATVLKRAERIVDCEIVFQSPDQLPSGFSLPAGRTKPWGTAHAMLSAKNAVHTPFAVINADDFYGRSAYFELSNFLSPLAFTKEKYKYCMVGYSLKNTVSEHGSVSRGVCDIDKLGFLKSITERTKINSDSKGISYIENEKLCYISPDTIVSMNCFGFTPEIFAETEEMFVKFLSDDKTDLMNSELYLPSVPSMLLESGKATLKVLTCGEKWYGFTYKEDRATVVEAIEQMTRKGLY